MRPPAISASGVKIAITVESTSETSRICRAVARGRRSPPQLSGIVTARPMRNRPVTKGQKPLAVAPSAHPTSARMMSL